MPFALFLVVYIGGGIDYNDFYKMPAIVVFLIALTFAFVQNKQFSFSEKMSIIAKEVGDDNIITMCLVVLAAGGSSGSI